jgi:hypothetical protein
MESFYKILESQIKNKHVYIKNGPLVEGSIRIIIYKNRIKDVINGPGWIHSTRKMQYIKLIENVLKKSTIIDGNININLQDHPSSGYLNFCRLNDNNNQFLLPDFRFTLDDIVLTKEWEKDKYKNFDETTQYLQNFHSNYIFNDKINKFYTSCIPHHKKLEYFLFASQNLNLCSGHMYGGSVHGYNKTSRQFVDVLESSGLASKEYKTFDEHFKYKYIIYNDGNTLSNRMKLLLNVNSVIIKQTSPYEEMYTYLLKDKINFIEYNKTSELKNIHTLLENDTDLCKQIIENNKLFVKDVINYDNIMQYTSILLNKLL